VETIYDLCRYDARLYIRRVEAGRRLTTPALIRLAGYDQELTDAILESIQVPVIPIPPVEVPAPAPVTSPYPYPVSTLSIILPITQTNFVQQPQAVKYIASLTFGPPQALNGTSYPQYVIDVLNSTFSQMPTPQQVRALPSATPTVAPPLRPRPSPLLTFTAVPVGGNRWTLVFNGTPIRTYNSRKTARTIGRVIANQINSAIRQKAPSQIAAVIIYDILLAWTDPNVIAPPSLVQIDLDWHLRLQGGDFHKLLKTENATWQSGMQHCIPDYHDGID
jgi:hypothetical protein